MNNAYTIPAGWNTAPEDPSDGFADDVRWFFRSNGRAPCPDCGSVHGDVRDRDCRTCGGCWDDVGEWIGGEE